MNSRDLTPHQQKRLKRLRFLVRAINPHMTATEQEATAQYLFNEWLNAGETESAEVQA